MTMAEMSELMQMDRTTLLRAVKPLREKAWVNANPQKGEPRRHVLRLSTAGRAKIKEAMPLWRAAQAEYEAAVGAKQARRMRGEFLNMTRAR